jgi:UDP-N-acetylmuramate--alanine ligase
MKTTDERASRLHSDVYAVVTGGGTSGHVLPAIAVLEALEDSGISADRLRFVGCRRGIDARLMGDTPYESVFLPVSGLRRSMSLGAIRDNLALVWRLWNSTRRARRLLRNWQPQVVVSVGGYASEPMARAAVSQGVPLVCVSYDRTPGLATRRQARHAVGSAVAFSDSDLPRAHHTGAPVRRHVRTIDVTSRREEARNILGIPTDIMLVTVMGGSLGSAALNSACRAFVERCREQAHIIGQRPVGILHLCGDRFVENEGEESLQSGVWYRTVGYEPRIAEVYAASDVLVARAGASTVAEIAAVGVPSVLVPWPAAAEDHQRLNARWLAEAKAAELIEEAQLSTDVLFERITELLRDDEAREAMSRRARKLGEASRSDGLVRFINDVAQRRTTVASTDDIDGRRDEPARRIHVVGVGGPGMSAVATVLAEMGHRVSGSDLRRSHTMDQLEAAGVRVHIGHSPDHVEDVDTVVYSTAIPQDNIELVSARRAGIEVIHRGDMLGRICARARSVGVAGTHGKTTTSALLLRILGDAGREPSYVIGAEVGDTGRGAQWTGGEVLIVEADESDGTHEKLPLSSVILTNIDLDHLDHFGSLEGLVDSFDRFLRRVDGPVVVCIDDVNIQRLSAIKAVGRAVVTYGTNDNADVRVSDIDVTDSGTSFHLTTSSTTLVVTIPLFGEHNALNAAGAIALATTLGVSVREAAASLEGFGGVDRRFMECGSMSGVTFIDDYAHVPTEINAVLKAAAQRYANRGRLVAVFQPNRYHRIAAMANEFGACFSAADLVVITDIYASGTTPIPGVTGELVADAVRAQHPTGAVLYVADRRQVSRTVAEHLRAGDVVVSMGCGDIETFPQEAILELGVSAVKKWCDARSITSELNGEVGRLTTYRVGGRARLVVAPDNMDQVREFAGQVPPPVPFYALGNGSNTLVSDHGFDGVVLCLPRTSGTIAGDEIDYRVDGDSCVATVDASMKLPVFARRTVADGWCGAEWMVGVPGTMGGAVRMNAGGHGSDMASSVVAIEIFDVNTGHRAWVSASDIGFRFRHSALDDAHLVSRVQVSLQSTSSTEHNCDGALSDIVAWRRAHQPGGQNAGSVFVNPGEGDGSAGALIDSLGLRGWRCGTAHVSELHANFVQADQGGSADDVLEVMRHVQQQVSGSTGILLRSEIRLLGFSEDVVAEFSSHRSYSTDDDAVNEARARLLRHL